MAFVAFVDTCVLFPANLRGVIRTIAEVGICPIRWSPDVLDEWKQTDIKKSPVDVFKAKVGASYLLGIMKDAFPDAMVERRYDAPMISAMPNAEKDRHPVLAAAMAGGADVWVTAHRNDCRVPAGFCDTDVQHPDEFLRYPLELAPQEFFHARKDLSSHRHPPMNSVLGILNAVQKTVPQFASPAQTLWPDYLS